MSLVEYAARESEARYRRLRDTGGADVAVDYRGGSFDDFDLRPWLDAVLPRLALPAGARALEYGTGTGAGACYLAARGFAVDAVDVAPTAIELARRFAAERGLAVSYRVADICELAAPPRGYALVVDSFCLHRLVGDAQRARALANVRELLAAPGWFVIGCVVARADRDYGEDVRDAQTGIVYRALADGDGDGDDAAQRYAGAERRGDRWYAPRARHVEPAELAAELARAGFAVVEQAGGRLVCRVA